MGDFVHLGGCKEHYDLDSPCRNWQGSPIILLPDGSGKTLRYARASSYGDALDDKNSLIPWSQANALRGLVLDPALAVEFSDADDGWVTQEAKTATKAVIKKAALIGGAERKANLGTDLHRWTELLDRGEPLGDVPPEFEADLMAYEYATRDVEHLLIERFCVVDSQKVAGTPDRIVKYDGDTYVWDLKTGSVGFPGKMAVQLALYAHSQLYTQNADGTATRQQLPLVNLERAIILNLPAGSGSAQLYWLDIAKGWKAVEETIPTVKAWRSDKSILTPIAS